jgi:hypothetical protein
MVFLNIKFVDYAKAKFECFLHYMKIIGEPLHSMKKVSLVETPFELRPLHVEAMAKRLGITLQSNSNPTRFTRIRSVGNSITGITVPNKYENSTRANQNILINETDLYWIAHQILAAPLASNYLSNIGNSLSNFN